jgi:hypothetical protein
VNPVLGVNAEHFGPISNGGDRLRREGHRMKAQFRLGDDNAADRPIDLRWQHEVAPGKVAGPTFQLSLRDGGKRAKQLIEFGLQCAVLGCLVEHQRDKLGDPA